MINLTYEELLLEADNNKLVTKEKNLPVSKGRIKGHRIAIDRKLTTTEKACVLAEELGHHYTTVGNILNQSSVENRKQELKARIIAYDKMIGLSGIIKAYNAGCRNRYEVSEYLDVTEEFLVDALSHYESKHGLCTTYGEYLIYFNPLGVLKRV